MSKDKIQLLSPLFLKHQADFEKNPRSRVFAPLAETYRKLGMSDKAMEILSQGIRFHPTYIMGYVGLAFCYYDLKQFNLAYSTIRPLVESNRDNLRLQKLFSDVCLELGKKEEALETLKYLLFINPRDKNIAELVLRIEKEVDDKYKPQHRPISIPAEELTTEIEAGLKPGLFDLEKLNNSISATKSDFDDWITYDLNLESKSVNTSISSSSTQFTNHDHWSVIKGDEGHAIPITKDEDNKNEEVEVEVEEEIRSYHVHLDVATEISSEEKVYVEDSTPMVTHTLVDLYCGQGHIEKALDVLEKILLLNPKDQKTISKIKEIQALSPPVEELREAEKVHDELMEKTESSINYPIEDVTEEEGRRYLMSLIDEKLGPIEIIEKDIVNQRAKLIEEKLSVFLKKIQKRALDYQCRV